MLTVTDLVHSELRSASKALTSDHRALVQLAQTYDATPVGAFIRRALEWRLDERKSVWLHSFLYRVVRCTDTGFMRQFTAFVKGPLLGDGCFSLVWRGSAGEPLISDHPNARPQVWDVKTRDASEFKNAEILLDAMDVIEHRESEQAARFRAMEHCA